MSECPDPGPAGGGEPADVVPMLSLVACNKCRRRRGAQFHATGRVEPVPEKGTCPHGKPLRTLWAPGFGPGADPPEFEWNRQAPL